MNDAFSPLVSVIIPTYNRSRMIMRTINSVLNQTYTNLEIIIVDDNSPDDTSKIISGIKDERIVYIKHKINKGAPAARNSGINASKGEFIQLLDDDDIIFPHKINSQIEKFKELPENVGLLHSGFYIVDDINNRILKKNHPNKDYKGYIYQKVLDSNVAPTFTLLIRRSVFEKVGGFDEDFKSRQEMEMSVRITKEFFIDYVDIIAGIYYIHGNQISTNVDRRLQGVIRFINKYHDELEKYPLKYISNLNYLAMLLFLKEKKYQAKICLKNSLNRKFSIKTVIILIMITLIPKIFKKIYLKKTLIGNIFKLKT